MEDIETHSFAFIDGWQTNAICKDGSYKIGFGHTEEESKIKALNAARDHHRFLDSNPRDRLKEILSHAPAPNYLFANDITHAIRAIAEILLKEDK
jgi:hypothetical protein